MPESADISPVYISRPVPSAALDLLTRSGYCYELHDHVQPLCPDALRNAVVGRHGLICHLGDCIDRPLLQAAAPTCRVVATISAGVDHVDLAAAADLGILVTHTPGVLTETTADLTWALMLATARRLGEAERCLRSGRWTGWGLMQFLGSDVHGATLGIVGGGRIAAAVARRAAGFDMTLLCCTRHPDPARFPAPARFVDLPALLAESDYVSLHVPLTPETHHLIGADELHRMKPSAILINTARGPVVDEAALIDVLRRRRIAAAGLDVYEREPDVPPALLELDNVVLLPHIGSASRVTRETMACMAAESVVTVLEGGRPRYAAATDD